MNSKHTDNVDFGAFVKRQAAMAAQQRVDWPRERDEWLSRLNELYDRIEAFLADYVKVGEIEIKYHDIALNEENIGSYTARRMTVRIGLQEITMTPVGTLLIGAKGRVDVDGPAGRTRFVLVNSEASGPRLKVTVTVGEPERAVAKTPPKDIRWEWKIATSPPQIRYIELTRESLSQALLEVANG